MATIPILTLLFATPSDWIASWRQELYSLGKIWHFSGKLLPRCMHLSYAF
jgi:hypothetical protein